MTDAGTTTTRPKESVADRLWIDQAGNEVDSPEAATGGCYVDKASGKKFVYQTGLPAGNHVTMLAVFGMLTKAGNIRSTLWQKDPSADIIGGIEDWFAELVDNSTWSADRVGGGVRVNAEVLAKAIAYVKGEHGDDAHEKYLARIQAKDKVKDPGDQTGKKEILYATFALRNTAVRDRYHTTLPAPAAVAPEASDL